MSLRLLLGLLPEAPDENNQTTHEEINITRKGIENYVNIIVHYQTPAKFHIGMLVISLLLGIAYGGYTAYTCWTGKQPFLGYTRNLVIALVCRTFFSIVFDGAILLGSPFDVGGGNFLLSAERICLHLVIAFWLTMNIYLHERVQSNFNNEPTLLIYQIAVPGIAVFFAFIWIFTLQDQWPIVAWWIFLNPFTQWIANSINLLYLFIQLALLANIVMAMKKITLDNDGVSLQRKIAAMMAVLVFIFWLQFGLSIGLVPMYSSQSYLYFFYFIDGLECAFICLVLYFFNKWVMEFLNRVTSLCLESEESRTSRPNEILLSGNRGIVTIDSVFMTRESGRLKSAEEEESKDVVYSNVIEPERLKKTLDLYKRLNVIPTTQVTTVEGEEFYDCQLQNSLVSENSDSSKVSKRFGSITSNTSKNRVLQEDKNSKSVKMREQKQKRNAFYSSKYLILDSKENDIPKYLETRPSVSSMSGKDSLKDERIKGDLFYDISMSSDLVQKWLKDNENMKNGSTKPRDSKERKRKISKISNDGYFNAEVSTPQLESTENKSKENENQISPLKMIHSAINSVSNVFFGSSTNGTKNLDEESAKNIQKYSEQSHTEPIKTDPSEKGTNKNISNENLSSGDVEVKIESKKSQNTDKEEEQEIPIPQIKVNQQLDSSEHENSLQFRVKNEKASEKLQERNQISSYDENSVTKPKNFKELTEERSVNETENQINNETHDVLKNQIEKLPSSESKEGRTHPETPQSTSDSPVEELKNNISRSYEVSELKIEPVLKTDVKELKPEKTENDSITYSDLLEFRLQREKMANNQPTDVIKKSFDFSEAFSSTIGFLISTGTNFFNTRKQSECQISEFEKSEKKSSEVAPQRIEDKPDLKSQDNANEELELRDSIKLDNSDNNNNIKLQEYDSPRIHPTNIQQIEPVPKTEVTNKNEIQSVPDSQMKKLNTSNETALTDKYQNRHVTDEFFTNLNDTTVSKTESHLPDHHSPTQQDPFEYQKIATAKAVKESTESSESEFEIERKRDSSSSAGSFSVDQYYSQLMRLNEKLNQQSNPVSEKFQNRYRKPLN